jgi:hypothetical protein
LHNLSQQGNLQGLSITRIACYLHLESGSKKPIHETQVDIFSRAPYNVGEVAPGPMTGDESRFVTGKRGSQTNIEREK